MNPVVSTLLNDSGILAAIVVSVIGLIITWRGQRVTAKVQKEQTSLQELSTLLTERREELTERRNEVQLLEGKVEKQGAVIEELRVEIQKLTISNQTMTGLYQAQLQENQKLMAFIHMNEDLLNKNYLLLQQMNIRTEAILPTLLTTSSTPSSVPTEKDAKPIKKTRGIFVPSPTLPPNPDPASNPLSS